VHKADNRNTICAVVMKSGNLNFLEPSGPIQACNWTALPLPLLLTHLLKSGNLNFLEPSGPIQACNWTALPLHLLAKFLITVLGYSNNVKWYLTKNENKYHNVVI
jgi:hypothetical protein